VNKLKTLLKKLGYVPTPFYKLRSPCIQCIARVLSKNAPKISKVLFYSIAGLEWCGFVSSRVKELLARMSVEEKVAQLMSVPVDRLVDGRAFSEEKARQILRHGIGEITRVGGSGLGFSPGEAARIANHVQRFLVEKTRLGILAIIHEECLAGLLAPTATAFPQAIALASTWNPELVHRVASAIRQQVLSIGSRHCLSPVLDLCRDPRWGRCEETYGEDPYLVASICLAYVSGL